MLIGVTGGIGSGKTSVAALLSELLVAPYHSSDEICRELLNRDQPGYLEFVNTFGGGFLDGSGNIDRSLLRSHIFSDESSRQKLESILHPLVRERILKGRDAVSTDTPVVAEVPLLFECGWENDYDSIICVIASRDTVIQRIMTRDCVSKTDAECIIDVQMDVVEKAERSDWVIDNNSDAEQTGSQVAKVAKWIRDRSEK